MQNLDDEIKNLQIEKLKLEIDEQKNNSLRPEDSLIKKRAIFFFKYLFPPLINIAVALLGYFILQKTKFFETSERKLQIDKNILNAEIQLKSHRLSLIEKSISRKSAYYNTLDSHNKHLETYTTELEQKINNLSYTEYQLSKKVEALNFHTANLQNINADLNNLNQELTSKNEHLIPLYFLSLFKDKINLPVAELSIDYALRDNKKKIFIDSLTKFMINTSVDSSKKFYYNYILYHLSDEKIFIDASLNHINKQLNTNEISEDLINILVNGSFKLEDRLLIQDKCMNLSKQKIKENFTYNHNITNLLRVATSYAFNQKEDYRMYKENTSKFIDLLVTISNHLERDSLYEGDGALMHTDLSRLCPSLHIAYNVCYRRKVEGYKVRNQNFYKRLFTIDLFAESYGDFLGNRLYQNDKNYTKKYKTKLISPTQWFKDRKDLTRWIERDMTYFRENPQMLIEAIENDRWFSIW